MTISWSWEMIVGILAAIVTLLVAISKGLISFGGTSEQTQRNTEDIAEIKNSLENKADSESIDDELPSINEKLEAKADGETVDESLQEIKDRIDAMADEIQTLKEKVAYLEGSTSTESEEEK